MMFLGKSDTGGRKQVREEDRQGVQRNGEKGEGDYGKFHVGSYGFPFTPV